MTDGPDFLTFLIEIGGECEGAAHPWWDVQIVNFDLKTGQQTGLLEYLPEAWVETGDPTEPLFDIYVSAAGPNLTDECLESLTFALTKQYLRFDIGLDTRTQTLLILPVGLPHVEIGCVEPVGAKPDALQKAGFDPRLVKAIGDQL
ncbi:hypothetical protein [Tabrizicola sp.]|uniref:hypothetical protein n=1 Tax=Tabrizicola sp. TaxID=2005166 RepID=UPI003F3C48C4